VVSAKVDDLDLVDNHGFVSKVDNWFRHSQRERSQPGSIASYEDECLHTLLTDCNTVELPLMFVVGCVASIVGRCTIKSESLTTAAYNQAESHSRRGDDTLCVSALRDISTKTEKQKPRNTTAYYC
jgi:hypothetical protein